MDTPTIEVLVVDDHVIVRRGIAALLAEVEDIDVVGQASDGQQAITQASTLSPDVVLMDLVMPGVDGIEATRQIAQQESAPRILVLTSFASDDKVFPAIKAGALGYLLKDSEPSDLVAAIRQVYRGEPSLQPSIARKLLEELKQPAARPPTPDPLTAREMEVLGLVAKGLSNPEIAEQIVVSEATVRTHVSNILGKLHVANRVQATLYALQTGITSLDGSLTSK
jgi:NarL family two-component system response regulator LiaR